VGTPYNAVSSCLAAAKQKHTSVHAQSTSLKENIKMVCSEKLKINFT